MKTRGFRIGRVGGIDVVVDYSWFVVFFLLTYSMAEASFPESYQGYSRLQYWLMGVIATVLIFISILVHELAHSWISIKRGMKVTGVRLFIFGGLAENDSEPKNGRDEFLIALAGPAASMFLGMISIGILVVMMAVVKSPEPANGILQWVAAANIGLTVFNLAPGFPLDGGRILRAFLWDHWNDLSRATRMASRIGSAVALFLIIFGVLQMILARDFMFGLWSVCIGLFMKWAAANDAKAVVVKTELESVPVRRLMKEDVATVDWLLSVREFDEDYAGRYHTTDFPVLNQGEMIGMVSLEGVQSVEQRLRDFKQMRDIMVPVEQMVCLTPEDDINDALERMISSGVECMPVTEQGRLMGMVSRGDILNYFKNKPDTNET